MPGLRFNFRCFALCGRTYPVGRGSLWDQLGQTPQILHGSREREFIGGAGEPSETQAVQPEDALEVREQYLHLLAFAARALVLRSVSDLPRHLAR